MLLHFLTPAFHSDTSITPQPSSSMHPSPGRLAFQWRKKPWSEAWVHSNCNLSYLYTYINPGRDMVKQQARQCFLSGTSAQHQCPVPRTQESASGIDSNWRPKQKANSPATHTTPSPRSTASTRTLHNRDWQYSISSWNWTFVCVMHWWVCVTVTCVPIHRE